MIHPTVNEVIAGLETYGPAQLGELLVRLTPFLSRIPLDPLVLFGEELLQVANAKTEAAAMAASVASADAAVDAAEAVALQAKS
jgi:hypothetical protein